jgi:acyl-CoA synthetase (AMP-forming)/AMP-acid ligase II
VAASAEAACYLPDIDRLGAEGTFRTLRHFAQMGRSFRFFVVGGAPLDPDVERFWEAMGFPVLQGYGLTEAAPVVALNRMESMAALPALVRMLDDGDFDVRLHAVHGLATLSGQRNLHPSFDAFRQNEMWFVAPLRVWAAMHGVQ